MKRLWSKIKIRYKLIITFLVVAILSSGSGFISLYLMKSADTQYSYALTNYGFSQGDIGLLMEALKSNTANVILTMATDDQSLIQQAQDDIQKNSAAISQYMANVEKTLITTAEKDCYKTIADNLPLFTSHATEVMSLAAQNKDAEAMQVYQEEAVEHIESIENAIDQLMSLTRTTGNDLSEQLTRQSNMTIVFMLLFSILSLAVSIVLASFIARSISRPMASCSERLVSLSEGDLQTPVPTVDSEDEMGVLANATDELVGKLRVLISQMTSILSSIADGNLDVAYTREFGGDFAALHTSSSKIIDSLNDAFHLIIEAAEQVDTGSNQVSDGAQALSQGTTEQASSIQELAATINEISAHVNANASNAQDARSESEKQVNSLAESNKKMQDMVDAMSQINNKSEEISKIIKTIEDIAFQTNILALNAAVEAARAGSAGKGFAVVADEVRSLAGKSSDAAKDTTSLIEETIYAVDHGSQIANETALSLEEVITSSHKVAELVEKIADSSSEQASSVNQITLGIDQISQVVQTNSATAEESAAASQELAGQARLMSDMVGRFKLKNQ